MRVCVCGGADGGGGGEGERIFWYRIEIFMNPSGRSPLSFFQVLSLFGVGISGKARVGGLRLGSKSMQSSAQDILPLSNASTPTKKGCRCKCKLA